MKMTDGARELDRATRDEAAEDEYARALECPSCGLKLLDCTDYGDLDAHLRLECEGGEDVEDLLTGAAA